MNGYTFKRGSISAIVGLPVQMYRKSYYTTPGVSVGGSIGGGGSVCKMVEFAVIVFYPNVL